LFNVSESWIRNSVKRRLREIGVCPTDYSTHSFRKGGATQAAKKGVQDCVVKAHGRWKSTCFMRYTVFERADAGRQITAALG
jgi:hypothetical protein